MALVEIDKNTCIKCGKCAAVCIGNLIAFRPESYPRPLPAPDAACLKCGHCAAVCPTGSLTHRDMPLDQFPLIQKELEVSAAECEQLLRSRRSIREYKNQPVPREVITRLIEIARYAPTGHNDQEVRWTVIDNRAELQKLEEVGTEWMRWTIDNRPKLAALFNMPVMLKNHEKQDFKTTFLRGTPVLVIAHAAKGNTVALIDSTIAMTFLDLAAKSQGLGCCWAGLVFAMAQDFPPMIQALNLPEGQAAHACMMLGYPKFSYTRLPMRKTPEITWH